MYKVQKQELWFYTSSSNKGASFLGVYFMGEDPSGGDENRTVIVKPSYDIVQYSLPSVDIRYHINVS